MNTQSSTGFFSGLILRAVASTAVALLYAPRPGTESRHMVKEKALEIQKRQQRQSIASWRAMSPPCDYHALLTPVNLDITCPTHINIPEHVFDC